MCRLCAGPGGSFLAGGGLQRALPRGTHIFHKHMKTNSTENSSFSPTGKAIPCCQHEQEVLLGPGGAAEPWGQAARLLLPAPHHRQAGCCRECSGRRVQQQSPNWLNITYTQTWPFLRVLILWDLCNLSRGLRDEPCLSLPASVVRQHTASCQHVSTDQE